MEIDMLSHWPTLCDQIQQALNLNSLCKYGNLHKTYLFENLKKPVNCSYIIVFLRQSACNAITRDIHQWYKINTNKITDNHNITLCNDPIIDMIPLPSAEPSESTTFETIVRLTPSQNQRDLPNNIPTQPISNTSILTNNKTCNPSQNNMGQPHDQPPLSCNGLAW